MESENMESNEERLDRVTAARLARLRSMPVDTSGLERMIQARIPRSTPHRTMRIADWLRPVRAIAASLLVLGVIGAILISMAGHPVEASAAEMARFHEDMVAGRVPVTHVDSIETANKTLAEQWAESPRLPKMPDDQAMACCMRSVKNRKVACVLLQGVDGPVTMTVANASDMKAPTSPIMTRAGISYHVQSFQQLNMVMTERNGRWICLIARLPTERLMNLASGLQF